MSTSSTGLFQSAGSCKFPLHDNGGGPRGRELRQIGIRGDQREVSRAGFAERINAADVNSPTPEAARPRVRNVGQAVHGFTIKRAMLTLPMWCRLPASSAQNYNQTSALELFPSPWRIGVEQGYHFVADIRLLGREEYIALVEERAELVEGQSFDVG